MINKKVKYFYSKTIQDFYEIGGEYSLNKDSS